MALITMTVFMRDDVEELQREQQGRPQDLSRDSRWRVKREFLIRKGQSLSSFFDRDIHHDDWLAHHQDHLNIAITLVHGYDPAAGLIHRSTLPKKSLASLVSTHSKTQACGSCLCRPWAAWVEKGLHPEEFAPYNSQHEKQTGIM